MIGFIWANTNDGILMIYLLESNVISVGTFWNKMNIPSILLSINYYIILQKVGSSTKYMKYSCKKIDFISRTVVLWIEIDQSY